MKLTLSKGADFAVVDRRFYSALKALGTWSFDGRYVRRGYKRNGKCATERLHTAVYRLAGLRAKALDHKNGNTLDCRFNNLRPTTSKLNGLNRGPQRNSTSGVKGVSWHKGRWRAVFRYTHLGYFDSKSEAANAYHQAATEYEKMLGYDCPVRKQYEEKLAA